MSNELMAGMVGLGIMRIQKAWMLYTCIPVFNFNDNWTLTEYQ